MVHFKREALSDPGLGLPEKYRKLFFLKGARTQEAADALADGLKDPSALLRHEVAFCLGQRRDVAAIGLLTALLSDKNEHPMVRHEAGEALGAIGTKECLVYLEKFQDDCCQEVAQTCQLALQRIQFFAGEAGEGYTEESAFSSVDPAPAYSSDTSVEQLSSLLNDEYRAIFDRYRALFALRNIGGSSAVSALEESLLGSSALLKHEVAYVLGQMQDKQAVSALRRVICDTEENAMVRHEAAEALGSIADSDCIQLLEAFSSDAEPIVADSCVVALDMLRHELSGEFQYVTTEA